MMKVLIKLLKHLKTLVSQTKKRKFFDPYWNSSWSQSGEDRVLCKLLKNKVGFFVDVGAHHPKRFSNTFLFYNRGWRGINIDAMPGSMSLFNKVRPRDINLEMGIGERQEKLDYFVFNEPALNGFSKDLSIKRSEMDSPYRIKSVIEVEVLPLRQVLDNYLPTDQVIDFMSIDVEGLDFQVLKSNDWSKYRPKYVLVEILGSSWHDIDRNDIVQFMRNVNYLICAKCRNTVFFEESLS